MWAFFIFVSKGFSGAIRLSETGRWPEIGLRTPRVSFHPPFTQIETHSKLFVFSGACQKWITPQLRWVRPLSRQSETPEGGVFERGSEKALAGWATTRSGDDAPGTAVTGSWTSHSLQLSATTEMRTLLPFDVINSTSASLVSVLTFAKAMVGQRRQNVAVFGYAVSITALRNPYQLFLKRSEAFDLCAHVR